MAAAQIPTAITTAQKILSKFPIYNFKINLFLINTRLWDHLGLGIHDDGGLWNFGGCGGGWDDRRELDRPLLELVGELLVQKIANHENCDNCNNVEDIEWRLGRNLLNGGAFSVVHDWWDHRVH